MSDHKNDNAAKPVVVKEAPSKESNASPAPKGQSQDADRHSKDRHPTSKK